MRRPNSWSCVLFVIVEMHRSRPDESGLDIHTEAHSRQIVCAANQRYHVLIVHKDHASNAVLLACSVSIEWKLGDIQSSGKLEA